MSDPTKTSESIRELDRLVFFGDAVFAIAITLLALEIRIPSLPSNVVGADAEAQIAQSLLALIPTLFSFVVSFFAIGGFWVGNHRVHHYIKRYDRYFLWINLFFLMCIVLIPAASALLGNYMQLRIVTVVYALVLALTGFAAWLVWWYASHNHKLIDKNLDPQISRAIYRQGVLTPLLFLCSIPLAFINPLLAQATWYLFLGFTILRR